MDDRIFLYSYCDPGYIHIAIHALQFIELKETIRSKYGIMLRFYKPG